ncbi:FlaD/FlaE family flagellar protein [Methanosalsum natronophilum]|uniref:FlaD/FlaE family flagellar protein n=1 Tax=Methanosalsum natronophilum TaxID=768733 RepID=UPI00216AACB7|nr:FlaD/FlaE family flagellar protein [Methanosalsum natronophilum]MCS3924572.1 flagellar protein FlaD [Methanosalsum natronophilum]
MVNLKSKLESLKSVVNKDKGDSSTPNDPFGNGEDPFGSDSVPFDTDVPDFGSVPDLSEPNLNENQSNNLPDFNQFSESMGDGFNPDSPQTSAPNTKEIEENKTKINTLEKKISKFEMSFKTMERENKDIKESVDKIDQSVIELLSLYEVVSNQVNPFVGDNESGRDTIERFDKAEKRINDIGNTTSEMKNEIKSLRYQLDHMGMSEDTESKVSEIEEKLDAFSQALSLLNDNVNDINTQLETNTKQIEENKDNLSDINELNSSIIERLDRIETILSSEKPLNDIDMSSEQDITSIETPLVKLETIKADPTRVIVLLNWIEFLIEKVGRNNLMDALDYYIDIGWISEDVRLEILAYARGIDYNIEKPTWKLLPEDHTKSLLFIERLSGRKIDKNVLGTLDREMTKVKHGLGEMYGL